MRWSRHNRSWGALAHTERRQIGIAAAIQFTLLAVAFRDWWRRPGWAMRGGRKWVWLPVLFANFVGPITYLVWGRHGQVR